MDQGFEQFTDGQLWVTVEAVLDALTGDRLRVPTDAEQFDGLTALVRVGSRVEAVCGCRVGAFGGTVGGVGGPRAVV